MRLVLVQFAFALLGAAILGDLARLRFLDHPGEHGARLGNGREAENFHRRRRARFGEPLAEMILHRAHASVRSSADESVALMQRAFLDQHGGDRAAPAVELRLDNRAARGPRRIRLQLHHVGLQQDHLEQLVDSLAGARRDRHRDRVAAVVFGHQPDLRQALLDVVEIRVGQIDLVDRDDYRNVGGARVIDRFLRLRHHAFVRGDHQHDDVGDLGAARAHRSERLVAGSIDERDRPPIRLDGVRADMLRDSAELARRDVGVANRVEQRGLAVIDVAHHGDDRRPRDPLARNRFLGRLFDNLLGVEGNVLDAVAELARQQRRGVDVEHLVERRHLAEFHQFLDEVAGLDAHRAAEVADGDALGDSHHALRGLGRRDFGLALFLAGQCAPLLRHPQPAHLALGGEIGAALLDDFLLLDSAPAAGLGRLIGRQLAASRRPAAPAAGCGAKRPVSPGRALGAPAAVREPGDAGRGGGAFGRRSILPRTFGPFWPSSSVGPVCDPRVRLIEPRSAVSAGRTRSVR